VLRPERNKRQHLSSLLSRNEVGRDYTYNRRLFVRIAHGWYQFNPELAVRRRSTSGEAWVPILDALNLRLAAELADPGLWPRIDALYAIAGAPPMATPIAGERAARQMAEERARREAAWREMEAQRREHAEDRRERDLPAPAGQPATPAAEASPPAAPPPGGTPAARHLEIERVRRQIAENEARRRENPDPTEPAS
jgi:hypothetical protein